MSLRIGWQCFFFAAVLHSAATQDGLAQAANDGNQAPTLAAIVTSPATISLDQQQTLLTAVPLQSASTAAPNQLPLQQQQQGAAAAPPTEANKLPEGIANGTSNSEGQVQAVVPLEGTAKMVNSTTEKPPPDAVSTATTAAKAEEANSSSSPCSDPDILKCFSLIAQQMNRTEQLLIMANASMGKPPQNVPTAADSSAAGKTVQAMVATAPEAGAAQNATLLVPVANRSAPFHVQQVGFQPSILTRTPVMSDANGQRSSAAMIAVSPPVANFVQPQLRQQQHQPQVLQRQQQVQPVAAFPNEQTPIFPSGSIVPAAVHQAELEDDEDLREPFVNAVLRRRKRYVSAFGNVKSFSKQHWQSKQKAREIPSKKHKKLQNRLHAAKKVASSERVQLNYKPSPVASKVIGGGSEDDGEDEMVDSDALQRTIMASLTSTNKNADPESPTRNQKQESGSLMASDSEGPDRKKEARQQQTPDESEGGFLVSESEGEKDMLGADARNPNSAKGSKASPRFDPLAGKTTVVENKAPPSSYAVTDIKSNGSTAGAEAKTEKPLVLPRSNHLIEDRKEALNGIEPPLKQETPAPLKPPLYGPNFGVPGFHLRFRRQAENAQPNGMVVTNAISSSPQGQNQPPNQQQVLPANGANVGNAANVQPLNPLGPVNGTAQPLQKNGMVPNSQLQNGQTGMQSGLGGPFGANGIQRANGSANGSLNGFAQNANQGSGFQLSAGGDNGTAIIDEMEEIKDLEMAPEGLVLVVKNPGKSNLEIGQMVDGNLNPVFSGDNTTMEQSTSASAASNVSFLSTATGSSGNERSMGSNNASKPAAGGQIGSGSNKPMISGGMLSGAATNHLNGNGTDKNAMSSGLNNGLADGLKNVSKNGLNNSGFNGSNQGNGLSAGLPNNQSNGVQNNVQPNAIGASSAGVTNKEVGGLPNANSAGTSGMNPTAQGLGGMSEKQQQNGQTNQQTPQQQQQQQMAAGASLLSPAVTVNAMPNDGTRNASV